MVITLVAKAVVSTLLLASTLISLSPLTCPAVKLPLLSIVANWLPSITDQVTDTSTVPSTLAVSLTVSPLLISSGALMPTVMVCAGGSGVGTPLPIKV